MTFAAPMLLLGLGLALPLIAAYLVRRRRRLVRVPSVLPWQRVAISRARNRRFRFLTRLLSLLAMLAAVIALVMASARPTLAGGEPPLAIVVDLSASMGTRDHGPLAEAIDEIERELQSTRPILLIGAGAEPERLAGPTRDSALLAAGLARLQTEHGGADLAGAVALARSLREGATVAVYHDGETDLALLPGRVIERRFGEHRSNVGITAFAARPADDARSDDDREVLVGVAASRGDARSVRVEIGTEDVVLAAEEVNVEPGGEVDVRFRVQLSADALWARIDAPEGDALANDNEATLSLSERELRPHFHAEDETDAFFARRALEAAGSTLTDDLDGAGVVVRVGPPSRPVDRPLLILGGEASEEARWPDGVSPLTTLAGDAAALRSVEGEHPVTRGVSLDGVTILRANAIDPGEGIALVELDGEGAGGTVVAAGGSGQSRWVYLGLSPNGSDVVLRVAYPLLVANALAWLGGASEVAIAETSPRSEVALDVAETASTLATTTPPVLPPLPVMLAILGALLLALEGYAYQRRWVG